LGNSIGGISRGGRNDISFRSGFFFSDGLARSNFLKVWRH
jgi:hypothetical protein